MPHLQALGLEVVAILTVGGDLQRNPLHHIKAVTFQADDLLGVVGHEAHLPDPQVPEDLGPDAVVPQIRLEAQGLVGLHGVGALVLEFVGPEFVDQADAPALLVHVENDAMAFAFHQLHGGLQLVAAVAPEGVKHIAGDTFGVDPHQDGFLGVDVPFYQGDVLVVIHIVVVGDGGELPEIGGQLDGGPAVDKRLVPQPMFHQILDSGDLDIMLDRKFLQVRHPGHGAVVLHDLADHRGAFETGQAGQVRGALGLPGAHQHPAFAGSDGENVPRAHQVIRLGIVRHRGEDGGGAVGSGNPGGNPAPSLDRHRERSLKPRLVVADHLGQLQALNVLRRQCQTDEAPPKAGHEIDEFGRHLLCRHGEVAFVFPVFVVHQDDYLALADILYSFFNG